MLYPGLGAGTDETRWMKVRKGWRTHGLVRRAVVLGVCFVLFALQPTLGGATVITHTYSEAGFSVSGPVADFYEYAGGTAATWTDTADFDSGTFTSTNSAAIPGAVVLDRIGPAGVVAPDLSIAWWDTGWTNRRCYEVDHTATGAVAVTEYQIRVDFPIDALIAEGFLQADLGDLRAIAADGVTSLPLWADSAVADSLWIQVDDIAAATTSNVCVYYGYAAGTATSPANHSEAAVFSHTTPKEIYYTVSDGYSAGSDINVVTYTDGNSISRSDGTTVTLATAGELTTFDAAANTPGTTFSVLGPISAAGTGIGLDTLVPISFAGTAFAAPISRDGQQFSFIAPFGDASITLSDGTTAVATFTVATGTPYTHTAEDITPGNTAIIESDVPVLVTHQTDLNGDSIALYPATAGAFYGIRSTELLLGYTTDTTAVAAATDDGISAAAPGDRGDATSLSGGTAQGGATGDGTLLTADNPIGVVTHEDGDGTESSIVLPATELGSVYWLPTDSQYVAFSCPTEESAAVPLTVAPPGIPNRAATCTGGPDIAWAADTADLAVTTSGISVSADGGDVFAAYYERLADDAQTALLGMKQGRQYTWPAPVTSAGSDEGLIESSGTWESATVDTVSGTEVFGLLSMLGSTPDAATLRVQIATADSGDPSSFVGPDGSAGTYFELTSLPAVADFAHDGDRYLRVRAELATTDPTADSPRLDSVAVDTHLPLMERSLGTLPTFAMATTIDPAVTTSYLLRVKTSDPALTNSEATAMYRGASNLTNLAVETVRFVNVELGMDSVQQSNTAPIDLPVTFDSGNPHSVVLDHAAVDPGITTIWFVWQLDYAAEGSIYLETDFQIEVTAP